MARLSRVWVGIVVAIGLLTPLTAAVGAEETASPGTASHPRLLFSATDVAAFRARFAEPGVPRQAWQRVTEKAEGHLLRVFPEVVRAGESIDPFNLTKDAERPYNLQNEMPTYLIELGFAYQMSGDTPEARDTRFGRRVIDLISALGDEGFPYWSRQDLGVGDLLEGVALGFDWTYELMSEAEREKIVGDIVRHESLLFRQTLFPEFSINSYANALNTSNWMGVTTGGAGLALLALQGVPGVPEHWYETDPATPATYWEQALLRIRDFLGHAVDPNGAYEEGLTYAVYGMKNAVPFAKALERAGYGNFFEGTGLPLLSRWMAFEQLPGEGQNFVPLNDSQRTMYGVDLFAQLFAINPGDGVAQWLWQRTVGLQGDDYYREPHVTYTLREDKCDRPLELASTAACDLYQFHGNVWAALWYQNPIETETPEVDPATTGPLSVHHGRRGLVDARTGFADGTGDVVSTFEARRDGRAHYQYDLGNFTLYGEGGRFAIDPGYSCVACKKPRHQMNPFERAQDEDGAYATFHNVLVIDGDTYTQKHDSRWNLLPDGRSIDSYVNAPNLTLSHANLAYAYEFVSPYAGRDHFFSRVPGRPVLLAVADHIQRDGNLHRYRWQMLTNNDNAVSTSGSSFTIGAPNGATLAGQTVAGGSILADPVVGVDSRVLRNPTDDIGKVMPVVFTESAPQLTFDHVAFMALTPAGEPAATTEPIRVTGGNAAGVTWKGVQDVFVRKLQGAPSVNGAVDTDATVAKFTRGAGETVMRRGTRLASSGQEYVSVTGSAATVTVSGSEVSASGESTNRYRVFAPQDITSVRVNGADAPSCRSGETLVFPCARTTLTYTGSTLARGEQVRVSARLADVGGTGVDGETVTFTMAGRSATATTSGGGHATTTLSVPDHGRSQTAEVRFAGRGPYEPSFTKALITWGALLE